MPMTPYSSDNQRFSNEAHKQARIDIYPLLFGVPAERLSYMERPDAQERDFHQAIDRDIEITVPGLSGKLCVSVQERFRQPKYAHHQDATITEFNCDSGLLGELYKIRAELMLYGYYDPLMARFIEAIAFWVAPLKFNIVGSNIQQQLGHNWRSNQDFLCFKFDELEELPGVVVFRKKWDISPSSPDTLPRPSDTNHIYKKTVKQTFETIKTTEMILGIPSDEFLDWVEKMRPYVEGNS